MGKEWMESKYVYTYYMARYNYLGRLIDDMMRSILFAADHNLLFLDKICSAKQTPSTLYIENLGSELWNWVLCYSVMIMFLRRDTVWQHTPTTESLTNGVRMQLRCRHTTAMNIDTLKLHTLPTTMSLLSHILSHVVSPRPITYTICASWHRKLTP